MTRLSILCLFLLAFTALPAYSQFHERILGNGLKVVVKEDHRAPIAVFMISYHVGSADEPGGITGVSHVLEHLMFKGTTHTPPGLFSKTVSSLGGQENAFTGQDITAYYELIAADSLPEMFKLEADRMQHMLFEKHAFEQEMKVIQEERRLRTDNDPKGTLIERFLATAHLSSPYHHPVIGWMSDLEHMTLEDAKAWYQKYYAPNNATLIIVGDVSPATVFDLATKYFASIPKRPTPPYRIQQEPPPMGKKTVTVNSALTTQPIVMLGYTAPTVNTATNPKDPYTLDVIAALLSAPGSGRLDKHLVRDKRIAAKASVNYLPFTRYQTQFIIYGIPSQLADVDDLKKAFLEEIDQLKTTPVNETELQRIKTQIIADKTFEKESILEQAKELALLETLGLGWKVGEQYVDHIQRVTALDIQNAARRYFHLDGLTDGSLVPVKESS